MMFAGMKWLLKFYVLEFLHTGIIYIFLPDVCIKDVIHPSRIESLNGLGSFRINNHDKDLESERRLDTETPPFVSSEKGSGAL